jgi:DNA-binding NarL/FixJ family response regulator
MQARRQRTAVLLDRHPHGGEAVETLLSGLEIKVTASTDSSHRALYLIRTHGPDLFLIRARSAEDVSEAINSIREAKTNNPELRAVIWSGQRETESIDAALLAGASAYVVESARPDDIAGAIRQVFETSVYIPTRESIRPVVPPPPTSARLTRRELEILELVAEGKSNSDVAKELWVTEPTVKFHLSNIYRKLGVTNRTEAARRARVHGLLDAAGRAARQSG